MIAQYNNWEQAERGIQGEKSCDNTFRNKRETEIISQRDRENNDIKKDREGEIEKRERAREIIVSSLRICICKRGGAKESEKEDIKHNINLKGY